MRFRACVNAISKRSSPSLPSIRAVISHGREANHAIRLHNSIGEVHLFGTKVKDGLDPLWATRESYTKYSVGVLAITP